jgi:transposase InsO family protein
MFVGKTFVADLIRGRKLEIASLRRQWKRRKPKELPRNAIWGMDLTGVTDGEKETSTVLGILDHGSRLAVSLRVVETKASTVLVRALLDSVDRFGKPKAVRTDNEAVFNSLVFRLSLFLMGIRHQKTQVHSPWQNGRVERFFGTLKRMAKRVKFENRASVGQAMETFRFWYNRVRPHQNLGGRTPMEAWNKVDPYTLPVRRSRPFQAWDGVLTGVVITHGRRC